MERVSTGGLKSFDYSKRAGSKLDEQEKREIEEAYARAGERKRREKRNRIIFWVAMVLLILAALGFFLFR